MGGSSYCWENKYPVVDLFLDTDPLLEMETVGYPIFLLNTNSNPRKFSSCAGE